MRTPFQRGAKVPMVTETHRRLALELSMAVEQLVALPSPTAYNQVSKMLAALGNAGMAGEALNMANGAMSDICDRYERVGKVGVNDAEAGRLRAALDGIDRDLPRIPVNRFEQAVAGVEIFCAEVGA